MLGELADELKNDEYLEKQISTGPKCYYYKTNKGNEVMKIKGFTLNYQNSLKLNGTTLEKVLNKKFDSLTLGYNTIVEIPKIN